MKTFKFDSIVKERLHEYVTFLKEFDERSNKIVQQNPNFFSHRLHWDEHPFCYCLRDLTNLETLEGIEFALRSCLVFSYSNEHWGMIESYWNSGPEIFDQKSNIDLGRRDLFQIYLKKGCTLRDSLKLADRVAIKLSKRIYKRFKVRKYTIMELTRILDEHYKKLGFYKVKYACKNAARYLAMTFPDLVDPDSPVTGGPGHFLGLSYIFNDNNIKTPVDSLYARLETGGLIPENDSRVTTWVNYMGILNGITIDIFDRQHWLNNEDKVCFFYKLQQFKNKERKAKKIKNMDAILPEWFSLKPGENIYKNLYKKQTKLFKS